MPKPASIEDLKKMGLNKYEAQAYLNLATHGPLPASLIAEKSSIPQSKVYEVMRSLISKSFVESWKTKPQRFKAVDPMFVFRRIIEDKRSYLRSLEEKSNQIIENLKKYKREDDFTFWAGKGQPAFLERITEMLGRIESSGCLTTTNFYRHYLLDDAFLSLFRKGVNVKILSVSSLDDHRIARASWYAKHGADIRVIPMNIKPVFGMGDYKEAIIKIDRDVENEFLWTNNLFLVDVIRHYFEDLWSRSSVFTVKPELIAT